jgi:predicted dehydrogenase
MAARYRVAVVGHTGRGNYGHGLDTVWRDLTECEVVAVADPDPDGLDQAMKRLRVAQGYSDYRKMLDMERPDIVSIAPRWLDQHHAMVLEAAQRGCHIYMEKPMCRTLQEADEMVAACEKNQVKFAIAHQTRYSPKLHVIREMIAEGLIGDLLELRGRGKEDTRGGGEDLWVLGSHVMNLMHHFGGEPQWCFAEVTQNGRPIILDDVQEGREGIGPLAGDTIQAMYGMSSSATAYFGSRRNANGNRFGLQIFGSTGVIEVLTGYLPGAFYLSDPSWSPGRSQAAWQPISSAGVGQPEPLADGGLHEGNILACRDLIAAIEEDRLPECNIYEARTTVEMIASVFASQRQGKRVELPLAQRENPLVAHGSS